MENNVFINEDKKEKKEVLFEIQEEDEINENSYYKWIIAIRKIKKTINFIFL